MKLRLKKQIIEVIQIKDKEKKERHFPNMFIFKFNVDGPSRVGKTCIIHKFWNGTFEPNYIPTIGVIASYVKEYYLFDCKITARFWDFGGSKNFSFLFEGRNSSYKAS